MIPTINKYGLLNHYGAYLQGKQAKINYPNYQWQDVLNTNIPLNLFHSFLDGWNDQNGKYIWFNHQTKTYTPTPWYQENARCPHCANYPMKISPDGILRCNSHLCNTAHYPPIDKNKQTAYQASLWQGENI